MDIQISIETVGNKQNSLKEGEEKYRREMKTFSVTLQNIPEDTEINEQFIRKYFLISEEQKVVESSSSGQYTFSDKPEVYPKSSSPPILRRQHSYIHETISLSEQ